MIRFPMFILRYVLTFLSEFLYRFSERKDCQAAGYKDGTIGAHFGCCKTTARYCASNKQPLYYCINRKAWLVWMNE